MGSYDCCFCSFDLLLLCVLLVVVEVGFDRPVVGSWNTPGGEHEVESGEEDGVELVESLDLRAFGRQKRIAIPTLYFGYRLLSIHLSQIQG